MNALEASQKLASLQNRVRILENIYDKFRGDRDFYEEAMVTLEYLNEARKDRDNLVSKLESVEL